jgi:hypothetical protein
MEAPVQKQEEVKEAAEGGDGGAAEDEQWHFSLHILYLLFHKLQ